MQPSILAVGGERAHALRFTKSLIAAITILSSPSIARDVGFAGFSYAGDFESIQRRFPYISQLVPPHGAGSGEPSPAEKQLREGVTSLRPASYNIVADKLTELEGKDDAIISILEITDETVSTERFDDVTKLFINLRAQAVFFDYKSMTVLRSYPISEVDIEALSSEPDDSLKLERIRALLMGGNHPGLITHFLERLNHGTLPQNVSHFIRVANVDLTEGAKAGLPPHLRKLGAAETWIADQFDEALLNKTGVSLLPFTKGYAIGNTIATHLADGTALNIKIPPSDYAVSLELKGTKKVLFGQVPAGRSYIYGAYVNVSIEEPMLHKQYFNATLKNGETKTVPSSQSTVDDWPAFQDAITGLFTKFADTLSPNSRDTNWIKSSTEAPDIAKQIDATRTVLKSCN